MPARYLIRVADVNGQNHETNDEEEHAKEWLWRTIHHLTNDASGDCPLWPPKIETFIRLEGKK